MSDSLSALISLQDQHPQNKLIQITKELISSTKNKISFIWVTSYVGISGYEKADTIAYEAVTSETAHFIKKSLRKT